MLSFREQVNANIPRQKTEEESENELKHNILKDVEKVSDLIHQHILEKAKNHTNSEKYTYRGVLSSSIFTEYSQYRDTSTIFSKKEEVNIFKNKYSDFFITQLRKKLSPDEIFVGDLMYGVCSHRDSDYNMPSSYFSEFRYQLSDENDERGYAFKLLSKPQKFIEPITVVHKFKSQNSSFYDTFCYCKRTLICEESMYKSYLWIGVQISY